MKLQLRFLTILIIASFFAGCSKDSVVEEVPCGKLATVEDHSDLDGCGFLFRLDNGEYVTAVWPYFCATPPADIPDNPMEEFEYVHGKRVSIDFEYIEGFTDICMKGETVVINCIKEINATEQF